MPAEAQEFVSTVTAEANGASIAAGAAAFADDNPIANQTDKCPLLEVEMQFQFSVAPADNARLSVFAIPKFDGTNEADASVNAPPHARFVCSIPVRAVTSAQRQGGIGPISSFSSRLWVVNETGQTLSSGWVLVGKTCRRATV